jgi:hypothetical protein
VEVPHALARSVDFSMDEALQLHQLTTALVARMATMAEAPREIS